MTWTPQQQPKRRRRWPWVLVAVVVAFVALVAALGSYSDRPAESGALSGSTFSPPPVAPPPPAAAETTAPRPPEPPAAAPAQPAQTADAATATAELAKLASLPIKGRAPKTGYSRAQFGPSWTDDVTVAGGHNGCDTRNDILRRDLTDLTIRPGSHGCTVLRGVLHDPYTGTSIAFTRGSATSNAVQIDHVVALSDAWQKGAQQLTAQQRENLANDPRNLQATDGPTNEQKGDGDAATWLPPNKSYRCTYVSRQVDVKAAYGLWVTPAEHDAIARILSGCGGSAEAQAPASTQAPPPASPEQPAVTPEQAPLVVPAPAGEGVYYRSCSAARAAGAAPLHAGQPGYRSELDRDGDGVACE